MTKTNSESVEQHIVRLQVCLMDSNDEEFKKSFLSDAGVAGKKSKELFDLYEKLNSEQKAEQAAFLKSLYFWNRMQLYYTYDSSIFHQDEFIEVARQRSRLLLNLGLIYKSMTKDEIIEEAKLLYTELANVSNYQLAETSLYMLYDAMQIQTSHDSTQAEDFQEIFSNHINNTISEAYNSIKNLTGDTMFGSEAPIFKGTQVSDSNNKSYYPLYIGQGVTDIHNLKATQQASYVVEAQRYVAMCNFYKELHDYQDGNQIDLSSEVSGAIDTIKEYLETNIITAGKRLNNQNNSGDNIEIQSFCHVFGNPTKEVKEAFTILQDNIPVGGFETLVQWIKLFTAWIFGESQTKDQQIKTSNNHRDSLKNKMVSFLGTDINQYREEQQLAFLLRKEVDFYLNPKNQVSNSDNLQYFKQITATNSLTNGTVFLATAEYILEKLNKCSDLEQIIKLLDLLKNLNDRYSFNVTIINALEKFVSLKVPELNDNNPLVGMDVGEVLEQAKNAFENAKADNKLVHRGFFNFTIQLKNEGTDENKNEYEDKSGYELQDL